MTSKRVAKRKAYFVGVLGAGGAAKMRAGGEEAEKIAKVRENHQMLNAMRREKLARAVQKILKENSIDIDAALTKHDACNRRSRDCQSAFGLTCSETRTA